MSLGYLAVVLAAVDRLACMQVLMSMLVDMGGSLNCLGDSFSESHLALCLLVSNANLL